MTTKSKPQYMVGVEASYFTTVLIDVSALRAIYDDEFFGYQNQYNIQDDEFEDAYDWMIAETISRILVVPQHASVANHHKHDVYRALYDHFKNNFEGYINSNVIVKNIKYAPGSKVKVLVAGPTVYLVKQGFFNE